MSFHNRDEFDPLELPIRGKTYIVRSPDAKTGLFVQAMMLAAAQVRAGGNVDDDTISSVVLNDDDERDLHERVLGDAYQQMLDDAVPWHLLKAAGVTTVLWITQGRVTAESYWNEGSDAPKARPVKKKAAKKSARSAPPA